MHGMSRLRTLLTAALKQIHFASIFTPLKSKIRARYKQLIEACTVLLILLYQQFIHRMNFENDDKARIDAA